MAATEPRVTTVDLERFDGRLDALIELVRANRGTIEFRRAGEATASVGWADGRQMFDFYYHRWGRERDPLMGALTLALTGEDRDEIETEIANVVAEVRREMRREREAAGG